MKKKILYLFGGILAFAAIAFGYITANKKQIVFADTTSSKLKICGKSFDMPVYLYIGEYDCQTDEAKVCNYSVGYNSRRESVSLDPFYYVKDTDSYNAMMSTIKYYVFTIEQDAFDIVDTPGEALSVNFIIVSYEKDLFTRGQVLNGTTVGSIMASYSDIESLIVPDVFELKKTHIFVEEDSTPVISGVNNLIITDIDKPITVSEIKSMLTAIDDTDGDITDRITIVSDNYSTAEITLATYTVVFDVADSAANHAQLSVSIKVEDTTGPVITGSSALQSKTDKPLNVESIKAGLKATDNYDSESTLKSRIIVVRDKFTENKMIPGTYEITFQCSDTSGNISYKNVSVYVIDNVIPIISGNATYTKTITANLKVSAIMAGLTATDDVDGNITSKVTLVSDDYTANQDKVGSYTVKFNVADSSGNKSSDFVVTINVTDDIVPVFYVDSSFITVTEYEAMSHQDIIDFLINTNAIKQNVNSVDFIYDEYSENSNKAGTYSVSLKANYDGEKSDVVNLSINVLESLVEEEEKEETLNFFQKLMVYLKTMFASIGAMFTNIFTYFKNLFSN